MAETHLQTALRALSETWKMSAASQNPTGVLERTNNETLAALMGADADRLARCAEELDALLASVPHEDAWQDISTAPKDGTPVLLWDTDSKSVNVGYYQENYTERWHGMVLGVDALWSDFDGPQPIFNATHWRPLPSPPLPRPTPTGETR
jgi:hypothetical protein